MNKKTRRTIREFAKYIFLTAVGIILFKYASAYATAQRGYQTVGGEYFLLLLPAIYAMVEEAAHGMAQSFTEIFGDWRKDQEWHTSKPGTDAHAAHITTPREKPTNARSAMYAQRNGLSATDTRARRSEFGNGALPDRWEAGNGRYGKRN